MPINPINSRTEDLSSAPFRGTTWVLPYLKVLSFFKKADVKFSPERAHYSQKAPLETPLTKLQSRLTAFVKDVYFRIQQEKIPNYSSIELTRCSTGGILLDRFFTSPLIALGFRVQMEEKNFVQVFKDLKASKTPIKALYAGTRPLMIRDLLFLPVFVPIFDKMRQGYFPQLLQPASELGKATITAAYYGTLVSLLSCTWQYFNPLPVKTSLKKALTTTFQEHGFRFYRGLKSPTHRITMISCLFNGFIAGFQQLFYSLRTELAKRNNP